MTGSPAAPFLFSAAAEPAGAGGVCLPPKSPASAPAAIASTSAAASAAARCRRGAIASPAAELRGAFLVTSPRHVTPVRPTSGL